MESPQRIWWEKVSEFVPETYWEVGIGGKWYVARARSIYASIFRVVMKFPDELDFNQGEMSVLPISREKQEKYRDLLGDEDVREVKFVPKSDIETEEGLA